MDIKLFFALLAVTQPVMIFLLLFNIDNIHRRPWQHILKHLFVTIGVAEAGYIGIEIISASKIYPEAISAIVVGTFVAFGLFKLTVYRLQQLNPMRNGHAVNAKH